MSREILVAVDGSEVSEKAFTKALEFARIMGASLHIISVIERVTAYETMLAEEIENMQVRTEEYFGEVQEDARTRAKEAGIEVKSAEIMRGHPADVIVDYTKSKDFDLVVLGRRGRGLGHRFRLGSTSHKVVAYSSCPVLVTP